MEERLTFVATWCTVASAIRANASSINANVGLQRPRSPAIVKSVQPSDSCASFSKDSCKFETARIWMLKFSMLTLDFVLLQKMSNSKKRFTTSYFSGIERGGGLLGERRRNCLCLLRLVYRHWLILFGGCLVARYTEHWKGGRHRIGRPRCGAST